MIAGQEELPKKKKPTWDGFHMVIQSGIFTVRVK